MDNQLLGEKQFVKRALTETESNFVEWLLSHGDERAQAFLPQIKNAQVIGICGCGCASLDFSIHGVSHYGKAGMEILCDYGWRSAENALFGVFAFACNGFLAGVDLWSIDSESTATELPNVEFLTCLGELS